MYSIVSTAIIQGIRSIPVSIEADVSNGMPMFEMVGFLASEVKEAKERVRTALKNCGHELPPKRITVNFIPADVRKSGSGFDLPIAIAVLSALGVVGEDAIRETFLVGEMGLNGRLNPVNGILPMVADAGERGMKRCIVPAENRREAALVGGMEVFGAGDLGDVVKILKNEPYDEPDDYYMERTPSSAGVDFSDIHGQRLVKRACEVAVGGMHNLLMVGPPGAGKTMIAMRIPTILPPLNEKEQMELSKIYSVGGLFVKDGALLSARPFRAPHHTVTVQGLTGGGVVPKPGEISLAHKGVLFLDELPEFQQTTIEALREPLEEKVVRISRIYGNCEYPADFILVAAMNPCRCGYFPDMQKCRCTQSSITRYINRVSQPLLDRIDVCVETPQVKFHELIGREPEEDSATIRERVMRTQQIQKERYKDENFDYNSQIPGARVAEFCPLDEKQEAHMEEMYKSLNLTARSYHKVLKVARTLADMDCSENIEMRHLNEAVCYRSPDRKFWER